MTRHRSRLLYLLGFMGCGKTTVGALLGRELGWPFIDLDATLEAGQGMTVREIFERDGEAFFRQIEHVALEQASRTPPAVIALGGGTFVQPRNLELIRSAGGASVWLDCPFEELYLRCQGLLTRPLLRGREDFQRLYTERLPFYRRADYSVATGGRSPEQVVEQILQLKAF